MPPKDTPSPSKSNAPKDDKEELLSAPTTADTPKSSSSPDTEVDFSKARTVLKERHDRAPPESTPDPSFSIRAVKHNESNNKQKADPGNEATATSNVTVAVTATGQTGDTSQQKADSSSNVNNVSSNQQHPHKSSSNNVSSSTGDHLKTPKTLSRIEVVGTSALEKYVTVALDGTPSSYLGNPKFDTIALSDGIKFKPSFKGFWKLDTIDTSESFSERINEQLSTSVPPIQHASQQWKVGNLLATAIPNPETLPALSSMLYHDDLTFGNDNYQRQYAKAILKDVSSYRHENHNTVLQRMDDYALNLNAFANAGKIPYAACDSMSNPWLSTQLPGDFAAIAREYLANGVWDPRDKKLVGPNLMSDVIDAMFCNEQADILNRITMDATANALSLNEVLTALSAKVSSNVSISIDVFDDKVRTHSALIRPAAEIGLLRQCGLGATPSSKKLYYDSISNLMSAALQLYSQDGSIHDIMMTRMAALPDSLKSDALGSIAQLFTHNAHNNMDGASGQALTLANVLTGDIAFPFVRTKLPTFRSTVAVATSASVVNMIKLVMYGVLSIKQLYHDPDFCTRWWYSLLTSLPTDATLSAYLTAWHPDAVGITLEVGTEYQHFPFIMNSQANPPVRRVPALIASIKKFLDTVRTHTLGATIKELVTSDLWRNDRRQVGEMAEYYSGGLMIPINNGMPVADSSPVFTAYHSLLDEIFSKQIYTSSSKTATNAIKEVLKSFLLDMGRSVVISASVKYHVAKAMARAGLINEEHTDYTVAKTHPMIPTTFLSSSGFDVLFRPCYIAASPDKITSQLIPVYIKSDAANGVEFNAMVKYTDDLQSFIMLQEILRNISTWSVLGPYIRPIIALTTTSNIWQRGDKLGTIADAAISHHRGLSYFFQLMEDLYPGALGMLNARFDNANNQDLRSADVVSCGVDAITGSVSTRFPYITLAYDTHMIFALVAATAYVNADMQSTISPTGTCVTLATYDQKTVSDTVEMNAAIPHDANTVDNLQSALAESAQDGNLYTSLTYSDPAGNQQTLILNDLADTTTPFKLAAFSIGKLSAVWAYSLAQLVARGNLILYFPNKTMGITQKVVHTDDPLIREQIAKEDDRIVALILAQSDESVPNHVATRLVSTVYAAPSRIPIPIRRLVANNTISAHTTEIAARWTDNREEASFRQSLVTPTRAATYDTLFNPVDMAGTPKRDIYPTCFMNPVVRVNRNYYYSVTDMFNGLTAAMTVHE